ncbi:MAG: divalent-cation tolerance protein CutA [Methanoregula sp.]
MTEISKDSPPEIVVVFCTAPHDASESMARELVGQRRVACVNVTPVRSFYRWKDEFCADNEDLLMAKIPKKDSAAVIAHIKSIHPYELPEIIVLPVVSGYVPYLNWVYQETQT